MTAKWCECGQSKKAHKRKKGKLVCQLQICNCKDFREGKVNESGERNLFLSAGKN